MNALRRFLARLGSPDAINWLSVVSVMVFQTCASLITSGVNFYDTFGLFLAVRLSSLGAFVAVLGLGKWLLVQTTRKRPQPLISLATFLVGITASTALFDWMLVATQLADQSFLARRVLLSLAGTTIILTMVAQIVTTARDYAAKNAGLTNAITETTQVQESTTERIQQRRDDLVATIHGLINDHLTQASLPGAKADQAMQNLIDDVIRPLSHALSKQPAPAPAPTTATTPSIPWRQVVRGALKGKPFSPLAFPGAIGAIVATFLVMSFGLQGLAVTIAVFIGAALINIVLGLLWRGLPERTPLAVRFVVFTASVLPFLGFSVVFIATTTGFDLASSPVRLLAWSLLVTGTWWVAVLTTSVFSQLRTTATKLENALVSLKTEVVSLNATDHTLRKNISRVLHGPVQEAVASSLRKLHTTPELAADAGYFDSVRYKIQTALDTLDTDAPAAIKLLDELDDLANVWEGSVTITHTMEAATRKTLDNHPRTAQILLELIREACQNAIKHGNAQAIAIALEIDTPVKTALLTVSNDGTPIKDNIEPGMGTALFDDLTLSWERRGTKTGVTVNASLPLG